MFTLEISVNGSQLSSVASNPKNTTQPRNVCPTHTHSKVGDGVYNKSPTHTKRNVVIGIQEKFHYFVCFIRFFISLVCFPMLFHSFSFTWSLLFFLYSCTTIKSLNLSSCTIFTPSCTRRFLRQLLLYFLIQNWQIILWAAFFSWNHVAWAIVECSNMSCSCMKAKYFTDCSMFHHVIWWAGAVSLATFYVHFAMLFADVK